MRFGRSLPATVGLPLTMVSPMKLNKRFARSLARWNLNSSGVSSKKPVVTSPDWKAWWFTTFWRNWIFVLTPRIRNSRKALSARTQAPRNETSHAVSFVRSES